MYILWDSAPEGMAATLMFWTAHNTEAQHSWWGQLDCSWAWIEDTMIRLGQPWCDFKKFSE